MIVEFVGGSLDKEQKVLDRWLDKIVVPIDGVLSDIYLLNSVYYKQLNWLYCFYSFYGRM